MGFKEWVQSRPVAVSPGLKDQVRLYGDRVEHGVGKATEAQPLAGATARVEQGSDIQARVTATRLLAIGVFALAAKKKSGGEVYLTVEGADFFWTVEIDRKHRATAQAFAAKVNDAARKATAESA